MKAAWQLPSSWPCGYQTSLTEKLRPIASGAGRSMALSTVQGMKLGGCTPVKAEESVTHPLQLIPLKPGHDSVMSIVVIIAASCLGILITCRGPNACSHAVSYVREQWEGRNSSDGCSVQAISSQYKPPFLSKAHAQAPEA